MYPRSPCPFNDRILYQRKFIVNATVPEVSSKVSGITAHSNALKGLSGSDAIARWETNSANADPLTQDPNAMQDVFSWASRFHVLFLRNRSRCRRENVLCFQSLANSFVKEILTERPTADTVLAGILQRIQ